MLPGHAKIIIIWATETLNVNLVSRGLSPNKERNTLSYQLDFQELVRMASNFLENGNLTIDYFEKSLKK
jgi:hypothetical protein